MITAMIGAFQTFTQGYMVDGGIKDSVLFFAYYLYENAFKWFKMGVRLCAGVGIVPDYYGIYAHCFQKQ